MIRKHQEKDLDSIMDIWYKSSTIAHPFLKETFVEKVKIDMKDLYIPGSDTWVYEENGSIQGFVSMMGNEVGGLFVRPNQQSKGIGKLLLKYVEDMNTELEVEVFDKNTKAKEFYLRYGFSIFEESFHEESGQEVIRLKFNIT